MRNLILILGDQLTMDSPVFENFDKTKDMVVMIEAVSEAKHAWSHKARIVLFLSAMRHFAKELTTAGFKVRYISADNSISDDFEATLNLVLQEQSPSALKVCEPGEWRMQQLIDKVSASNNVPLLVIDDTHFMCSKTEFSEWAGKKKELRLEFFYRVMRKKHRVLMEGPEHFPTPVGGAWNFDEENRAAFPKKAAGAIPAGPGVIPAPTTFTPDTITQEVIAFVEKTFPDHPGSLTSFAWPVTRENALVALDSFITNRLTLFGKFQDAMWTDTPVAWHSLISTSLNLHLISPREVITAAENAYQKGTVSLANVEGFIRQVLGWREFIRGIYWLDMPGMQEANKYNHQRKLPTWYWTGDTKMACMKAAIGQTLELGYAHHIQRLMVTGNFALLAELAPKEVSAWYLGIYVDAVEWVELPNTAGMALHALGTRFTSKPYISSGAYIKKQSNYCTNCCYDPAKKLGESACPFTTLYWNFLDKHEAEMTGNPRTALMVNNIKRFSADERENVRTKASFILDNLDTL